MQSLPAIFAALEWGRRRREIATTPHADKICRDYLAAGGSRTASITWITPLLAWMSATVTMVVPLR